VRRSCDEEKNRNYVLTVKTLVARNANEAVVAHMVESAFGGSLESGRFCVCAFGRNLASIAVKTFSHLNYFIKTFYKF
jgi:hypothetical protein